ncbi:MAG: hypothetical protein M1833_005142 [Piccolia ochrophora]|nr:MAG: hypothetical protein M1833_005142 [Piccolia ochrophora]
MAAPRRKNLVASRRRVEDESEEEGGPETAPVDDDSMSEASGISDLDDDDADAEGSDISEQDEAEPKSPASTKVGMNGNVHAANGKAGKSQSPSVPKEPVVIAPSDTDAMRNGLEMPSGTDHVPEIQFEEMAEAEQVQAEDAEDSESVPRAAKAAEMPYERRRREQEEYRKKRDADPTFVPNRGGFFMHDHRHAGPAANGFRPFGRGRGRGRVAVGGPFSPANQPPPTAEPTSSPWAHDLHEVVAPVGPQASQAAPNANTSSLKHLPHAPRNNPPNRTFSTSTHIGNVQVRVFMVGMKDPITFSAVPVKQHTRLPHHRPPLRRDKPVRVSLPDASPRYIFPAIDRSFIFIPRAMRPNQQGYVRGGVRGGFGPHRGFSSRRTSAYGGSGYSPSVTMSRRSSLAQEMSRDTVISPSGSTVSRAHGVPTEPSKPVVKLPPPEEEHFMPPPSMIRQAGIASDPAMPVVYLPPRQPYPPPQNPTYRENRSEPIPMHQPRPQKAVSVADIESPEKVAFPPPQQQQQQPFHHQMPPQANGQTYQQDPSLGQHSRTGSFPSQPSTGTPLSHIPERAIHAQPFQPHPYAQSYYPQGYPAAPPQGAYYYPPSDPRAPPYASSSVVPGPVFVPGPAQSSFTVPPAPSGTAPLQAGQGSTVAQESNGMVYYYDSSQLYGGGPGPYPPASAPYVSQPGGVVGMGGMMTPSPDGYYYPQAGQAPVYYGQ